MQKFDHVLLASGFDNTLVYTQSALDNGTDIPPMCPRNREALDYFIKTAACSPSPPAARCPRSWTTPRTCR